VSYSGGYDHFRVKTAGLSAPGWLSKYAYFSTTDEIRINQPINETGDWQKCKPANSDYGLR